MDLEKIFPRDENGKLFIKKNGRVPPGIILSMISNVSKKGRGKRVRKEIPEVVREQIL